MREKGIDTDCPMGSVVLSLLDSVDDGIRKLFQSRWWNLFSDTPYLSTLELPFRIYVVFPTFIALCSTLGMNKVLTLVGA